MLPFGRDLEPRSLAHVVITDPMAFFIVLEVVTSVFWLNADLANYILPTSAYQHFLKHFHCSAFMKLPSQIHLQTVFIFPFHPEPWCNIAGRSIMTPVFQPRVSCKTCNWKNHFNTPRH